MTYPHNLFDLADQLEVRIQQGESQEAFRRRVARAYYNSDPDDAAEAVGIYLGKHPDTLSDDELAFSAVLARRALQTRKELFEMTGDSHLSIRYQDYLDILLGVGFREVSSQEYDSSFGDKEVFKIFTRPNRGMFLTAESFGRSVNSTHLLYEVSLLRDGRLLDELGHMSLMDILSGAAHIRPEPYGSDNIIAYAVNLDAREGLVRHLQSLDEGGYHFLNPWRFTDFRYLPVLNYDENKRDLDDNNRKLRMQRIGELHPDAQKMIGYKK